MGQAFVLSKAKVFMATSLCHSLVRLTIGELLLKLTEIVEVWFEDTRRGNKQILTFPEEPVINIYLYWMKKTLAVFISILLSFSGTSQTANFQWAKSFGSSSADEGYTILVDASGNVYTTGIFNGTVDMDPGPGVFNLTSNGQSDNFISKLDALGNFVWAKQYGNSFNDNGRKSCIDNNGNIYITGLFFSTVDFDPGPAVYNLTCTTTGYAGFLLKIDQNGSFVWAKKIIETVEGYGSSGWSVSVAQSGNIYVGGSFKGSGDFDPGPGTFILSSSTTLADDIFISKFNSSGDFVWAKQFSGASGKVCYKIAVDAAENVFTSGVFYGTCDFDPGAATYNLSALPGSADAFIIKLDITGNFIFAKQVTGQFDENAWNMILDMSGNIFITGDFTGITDFDPGPGIYNLDAGSLQDAYILKLDNTGNFGWVTQFVSTGGASSSSRGFSVTTDNLGNVYTIGDFVGGVDFDPGASVYNQTAVGMEDTYISKLSSTGNFLYAAQLTGPVFTQAADIFVTQQKDLLITGRFMGTSDFNPSAAVFNLTSAGSSDAFILKLSQCIQSSSSLTVFACNFYTLNSQTYTSSGTYTQTIPNSTGCDSVITLNLTIGGSTVTTNITACDSYTWEGQTFTSSGSHSVTYPDANGCDSILNLNLIINYSISTNISAAICEGQSYAGYTIAGTYIDTYVGTNGCDSIRTLNLSVNPRSFSTINAVICQGEIFEGYSIPGIYKDTLTAANGCDSIRTLNLTVNPVKQTNLNASICEGEFYIAGGSPQTVSGIYRDTLQTYLGCDSIIITMLLVNPKPIPALGQDKELCAGSIVTFSPGSFSFYQWQDMSTLPTFTTNTTGLYWVKVTNGNNCSAADSIRVIAINSLPANFLKKTDSICTNQQLLIQPLQAYSSYLWSNRSSSNNITVQSLGRYWLTVKDAKGCMGTDTISVVRKNCFTGLYLPNAFTPDANGKNDVFKATVFGKVISFRLQIFGRYGQLVFETSDYQKGWDGNYKGKPYSTNVFVWQCSYQIEGRLPDFEKGTVMLLR